MHDRLLYLKHIAATSDCILITGGGEAAVFDGAWVTQPARILEHLLTAFGRVLFHLGVDAAHKKDRLVITSTDWRWLDALRVRRRGLTKVDHLRVLGLLRPLVLSL